MAPVGIVALVGLRREVRSVKEGICCGRAAGIDCNYSAVSLVPLFGIEHAIEWRSATNSTQVSRVMRPKLRLAARGALVIRLNASGIGGKRPLSLLLVV